MHYYSLNIKKLMKLLNNYLINDIILNTGIAKYTTYSNMQ